MTVSTDGQICYGILFEEEFEFPWSNDEDGLDGDWWRVVNGFKPPFELFNEDGEWINGVHPGPEIMKVYNEAESAFDEAHPLLVEIVNVCSRDYPIYILALKDIGLRAYRGHPQTFDPALLTVTDEQSNILIEFCKAYKIDIGDSKPDWYLSSFWG